jgi:RNA polymerase sigma-70 factor (ECF subfamily)
VSLAYNNIEDYNRTVDEIGRRMAKNVIAGLVSLFTITDEQAMWRVQTQNDHQAFDILVERWQERIRALCIRMTGNLHTAEDLLQETFSRVFEKRAAFRGDSKFSTWLWRIALNLCYDELRRQQRHPAAHEEQMEAVLRVHGIDSMTPRGHVQQLEEAELVREALMQLAENYRSVLVLRHYEGLKLREIAQVLEIPEGTVNSRMAEALSQLTRILEPQIKSGPRNQSRSANKPRELFAL